jgi:hypothetical protein
VTAEQVGLLGEYFRLARFLQPSMMVIEDVDQFRVKGVVPGRTFELDQVTGL